MTLIYEKTVTLSINKYGIIVYFFKCDFIVAKYTILSYKEVMKKTQAQNVIAKFGGPGALASLGGFPLTTVRSWLDSGFIPAKRQSGILKLALKEGIDLSPSDFFPQA